MIVCPEVSKFYGDQTDYKAIWHRFKTIKQHAVAQTRAVDAGIDPYTVEIRESVQKGIDD
jgi:hypothetical protein